MNTLDFELIRLGLSRQDPEAFAALRRIEAVQGELVAALEELLVSHSMASVGVGGSQRRIAAKEQARAVLAKAREGSKGDSA